MVGSLDTLPLSQIDEDLAFRLRPEGDVTGLAQSIAREGQLVPIEVRLRGPGRWQVVAGFRRVAALRLLKREHALARLHDQLSDEEALALAVADGVTERPLAREELEALRGRLAEEQRYGAAVQEAIERALGEAPPPPEPEEIDLDVFSREVRDRLAELAVDVGSLFENWNDADQEVREDVRAQLRYFRDLLPFLEEGSDDDSDGEGVSSDVISEPEP
jgi:ParB family transcriptional regulator, chromosome partitioning protein